ncbi:MAG: dipeptidase, partial [Synergistaceae bacterium]|nr:dipeptidase [Synergistaceae bacterium]
MSLFFVLLCAVCILFLLFPRASRACTSVVVGRNASSTGRVIVGHNEDDPGRLIVRHALVPSRRWDDGDVITAEERSARIPQPPRTLAFFWTQVRGERGLSNADGFYNERGVLVVSDSCLSSRLDDEPDLVAGG